MGYSLISTNYIPAEYGVKLVQGIKNGRIPRGAIKGGNGSFMVRTDAMPAQFYLYFEDEEGNKKCFEAYSTIKNNMINQKLTEKRCIRIADEVKKSAAESSFYEPEKWIVEAVQKLKI